MTTAIGRGFLSFNKYGAFMELPRGVLDEERWKISTELLNTLADEIPEESGGDQDDD
jgi:hypothetical protein